MGLYEFRLEFYSNIEVKETICNRISKLLKTFKPHET